VFEDNPDIQKVSKVFTIVLHRFNRKKSLSRSMIYDFYVRKIFEILIGKNEFYIKNLENILHPSIQDYKIQLFSSKKVQKDMKRYINLDWMNEIVQFSHSLNFANREYLDYNSNYNDYLHKASGLFRDLKNMIIKNLNFLPDLTKKLQIFNKDLTNNSETNDNIMEIQECVKYTLLFQKLEEFFFIYSEGKKFGHEGKIKSNSGRFHTGYLQFILNFLYMLVYNNYENLCLAMNFKSKSFVIALYEEKEILFDYLELISEMLISKNNYKFDNIFFLTESLNDIIEMIQFKDNDTGYSTVR